jgi:hypothetical protein
MQTLRWFLLSVLVGLSGCATLADGASQEVRVVTFPEGATLIYSGGSAITPCTVRLPRYGGADLVLEHPDFGTSRVHLDRNFNGTYLLNLGWILVWPVTVVGLIVDVATGAVIEYEPEYKFVLNSLPATRPSPPPRERPREYEPWDRGR